MNATIEIAGRAALLRLQAQRNLTGAPCLSRPAARSHAALNGVIECCDAAISQCDDAAYESACDDADAAAAAVAAAGLQLDKARAIYDSYADGTIYGTDA